MKFQVQCSVLLLTTLLVACGNNQTDSKNDPPPEIRPATKLTNDASAVANEAWILINQLDLLLYAENAQSNPDIDGMVREPLRELSTRWRIEVKMTDSVTEGKYALCRKSLQANKMLMLIQHLHQVVVLRARIVLHRITIVRTIHHLQTTQIL